MGVRVVDRQVGAVNHVAVHLVGDADGAVVARDVPLVGIRTAYREGTPATIDGVEVPDVPCELVQGRTDQATCGSSAVQQGPNRAR